MSMHEKPGQENSEIGWKNINKGGMFPICSLRSIVKVLPVSVLTKSKGEPNFMVLNNEMWPQCTPELHQLKSLLSMGSLFHLILANYHKSFIN